MADGEEVNVQNVLTGYTYVVFQKLEISINGVMDVSAGDILVMNTTVNPDLSYSYFSLWSRVAFSNARSGLVYSQDICDG